MALGGVAQITMAQWTSSGTAADAKIQLGFVPDYVIVVNDCQGTNPNMRFWLNPGNFSMAAAGADDSILDTGSTGVLTLDTASVAAYTGGDTVTATDVTNRLYFDEQGNVTAAGKITQAGILSPAGDQVNSGKNYLIAFRNDH